MNVFLIAIVLVAMAVMALAVTILLKKDGKFPELHIGKNEKLREKGISCATSQDKLERELKP